MITFEELWDTFRPLTPFEPIKAEENALTKYTTVSKEGSLVINDYLIRLGVMTGLTDELDCDKEFNVKRSVTIHKMISDSPDDVRAADLVVFIIKMDNSDTEYNKSIDHMLIKHEDLLKKLMVLAKLKRDDK